MVRFIYKSNSEYHTFLLEFHLGVQFNVLECTEMYLDVMGGTSLSRDLLK